MTCINNPSILTEDDKEPAATPLEETLLTMQQPPFMHPSLPPFSSSEVYWICEICDCSWPPSQTRCGTCKRWKGGKRTIRTSAKSKPKEKTVSKEKGKKRGRKSKSLTPIPGQDLDIPLVVGGALVVGDTTLSPLAGGLNSNESSLGQSTDTQSNDDATIGENTIARELNDEMIQVLDKNDAYDVGDGESSDGEGKGYECIVAFQDVMKEVEDKLLVF